MPRLRPHERWRRKLLAKDDIIDTLKDSVSLASRMAVRGVGEVSKAFKPSREGRGAAGETGLYHQRHLHPVFGKLSPQPEYVEFQQPRRFIAGLLKNLAVPAAERAFVTGCQELLKGNLAETCERMSEAFGKDAQFTDAYFLHGALSLSTEAFEDAVHTLKKVLLTQAKLSVKLRKYVPSLRFTLCLTENSSFGVYPDLLGTSILLSLAHRGKGDDDEAVNVLDQLMGVMPDSPVVAFFLALHYVEHARWDHVLDLLKDTMPDDNISLANLILLGKACTATGDSNTALEIYRKVLARTDFDPQLTIDVRHAMGTALARSGRRSEAEAEFGRVTRLYPGYMDMLERLGVEPGSRKKSAVPTVRAALPVPAAPAASPAVEARPMPPPAEPVASPPLDVQDAEYTMEEEEAAAAAPAGFVLHSVDGRVSRPLGDAPLVIGREEGDVVLDWDNAASRVHARVVHEAEGWTVEDLGSTNGTYVNGHRISGRVVLNRGDVLTIGQTQFRLE